MYVLQAQVNMYVDTKQYNYSGGFRGGAKWPIAPSLLETSKIQKAPCIDKNMH